MPRREITNSGPPVVVQPTKEGTYTLCLTHDGGTVAFRFLEPKDAPAFVNLKTDEVCHLMIPLIGGRDYTKALAHEKVRLVFEDRLVSPSGETRHKQWEWEDWVPLSP